MTTALRSLRDGYLAAQLQGDRDAALGLLERGVREGLAVQALEVHVIGSAQLEIGRLWEENTLSVVEEHAATAISQLALAHLYRHLPRAPRNGRSVVVACVEGEHHDMGPRIACDHLDAAGYAVRLLGANVPTAQLAADVARRRPDLLAVSVTLGHHLPAARAVVASVRAAGGPSLPIVVGGAAAGGLGVDDPAVHASLGSADELVALVDRLTGVSA